MNRLKLRQEDPAWLSEVKGLEPEFFDATGDLDAQQIGIPEVDEAEHVSMDNSETNIDDIVYTDGIYHCVTVLSSNKGYLAHFTPGDIGKTTEKLMDEIDTDVDQVTYAIGGAPDKELLSEIREFYDAQERTIYTGESGSIALDPEGTIYMPQN